MHVNTDSNFVDNMVSEVKSQGVFDAFRKDSMADVDTKPAYQNLKQRVENTVTKYLSEQKWTPELNKNQMREKLRKHIIDAGFLEVGVQRIVDQVVNPKISTVFQPRIEDIVYKYLGIDKPELKSDNKNQYSVDVNLTVNTDLLPTDLEAVSPDSDKSNTKSETQLEEKYHEIGHDNDEEDDESPPFEPLEDPSPSKIKDEDASNSHLSAISGLTSHSGTQDNNKNNKEESEIKGGVDKNYARNSVIDFGQESQLSQVSSNSRLSIGSNEEEKNKTKTNYMQESSENVDISEEAQMPKFSENSNSNQSPSGEVLHFDINKDKIKFEGTDRNNEILPPLYQRDMFDNCDDKNQLPNDQQMNVSQIVEDISNGTFNTESRNSTYFDDDSEKGGLQIIEDPTQDFSREEEQSCPPSAIFQKPEVKEEKYLLDESFPILNKNTIILCDSAEKKMEKLESKSPITTPKIIEDKICEKSILSEKGEDKTKVSKSSNANRHSSSSSSNKSYRSKDKKYENREKDKGRKSSSNDSKLFFGSNQSKNHSTCRHSSQSSPRSSNSAKENKDGKGNGSSFYKSGSSNKCLSASLLYKNDKPKGSDKDKDRKRDHERSRDEKSIKTEKQKSKEYDDHSSEKNKRYHRKSTDSNDGDKKGFFISKSLNGSKDTLTTKSSYEMKNDSDSFKRQDNSSHGVDINDSEAESIKNTAEILTEASSKVASNFGMSGPTIIDNLNTENIEFVIRSNVTHVQKPLPQLNYLKNESENKEISNNNETKHKIVEYAIQDNIKKTTNAKNEIITETVKKPDKTMLKFFQSDVNKSEILLPIIKRSPEKKRFETLISPPPKKRKYDMSFENDNYHQICQHITFNLNFDSSYKDGEINLFGFDIQEEQDNYQKIIKDYEESYVKYFECNSFLITRFQTDSKCKTGSNKNSHDTIIGKKIHTNSTNSIQKSKRSTDNKSVLELCHTSITNEQFNLSGKSLTINSFDYDLVPNPFKKKIKVITSPSTDIRNSKISPSLLVTVGSKENKFSEKINYNKKIKGADIRKGEKSNIQMLLATQRYTCDDLYKPRLTLSQRSRRRALDNEIL